MGRGRGRAAVTNQVVAEYRQQQHARVLLFPMRRHIFTHTHTNTSPNRFEQLYIPRKKIERDTNQ